MQELPRENADLTKHLNREVPAPVEHPLEHPQRPKSELAPPPPPPVSRQREAVILPSTRQEEPAAAAESEVRLPTSDWNLNDINDILSRAGAGEDASQQMQQILTEKIKRKDE